MQIIEFLGLNIIIIGVIVLIILIYLISLIKKRWKNKFLHTITKKNKI